MDVDSIKLTGENLSSVHTQRDPEVERIYAELYRECEATDFRVTRFRVARRAVVRVSTTSRGTGRVRRRRAHDPTPTTTVGRDVASSSTYNRRRPGRPRDVHEDVPEENVPEYDEDGNLINDGDFASVSTTDSSSKEDTHDSSSGSESESMRDPSSEAESLI